MTTDFHAFLRSRGLRPGRIVADGKWRRCPTDNHERKRNGAYKLATDGRVGWAQDWSTETSPAVWWADGVTEGARFDPREAARRRQAERAEQEKAIREASDFYRACSLLIGGHPYLEAHGLDMAGCSGLKVDRKGWLVVPAWRGGRLLTVQRIAPDGQKRFWPGAPVRGAAYTIERRTATLTVLCEGLATGLALYAAARTCRVVVAFNSGNLPVVAPLLPAGFAVVAADNDRGTEERIGTNPGVIAAEAAAKIAGCGVAIPTGIDGTDWCDYRTEHIAARLAKALPHEREAGIRLAVDGEIALELMRHASFRGHASDGRHPAA